MVTVINKKEGKESELVTYDPRLRNIKNLTRVKTLPVECNRCPFRAKDMGGNGICPKYKADSACTIRKDIQAAVDKFETRSPSIILDKLKAEFSANFETLRFYEELENLSGTLSPEVSRRINALVNVGKLIKDFETSKLTVELQEKNVLSDERKEEIARVIRVTKEKTDGNI